MWDYLSGCELNNPQLVADFQKSFGIESAFDENNNSLLNDEAPAKSNGSLHKRKHIKTITANTDHSHINSNIKINNRIW